LAKEPQKFGNLDEWINLKSVLWITCSNPIFFTYNPLSFLLHPKEGYDLTKYFINILMSVHGREEKQSTRGGFHHAIYAPRLHSTYCIFSQIWVHSKLYPLCPTFMKSKPGGDFIKFGRKARSNLGENSISWAKGANT
jgi:hypothetical protein